MLKKEHEDEDEDYRVPTFKALIEDYEQEKSPSKETDDKLQETSTFRNLGTVHTKEEGYVLPKRYEMKKKFEKTVQEERESEVEATPKR